MITLLVEENNPLTPNFYNNIIANLQFHRLTCPCTQSGCLSVHGYYKRAVKLPGGKVSFRICRVICEQCGHTHAILLSSMVPHSQVSLADHVAIIDNYNNGVSQSSVMNSNPCIDESCCRYIIRCYLRFWQEMLRSERLSLSPMRKLIISCFAHFSRQFMQIKNLPNILYPNTT